MASEDDDLRGHDPESEHPIEPEEYLANEDALLDVLLGVAKDNEADTRVVQIGRDPENAADAGNPDVDKRFWFRVRGIRDDEDDRCRKKATRFKRNRRLGMSMPEEVDVAQYRSLLILTATVEFLRPQGYDEDGNPKRDAAGNLMWNPAPIMWKDPKIRRGLGVETNWEVVDKLVKPGEKERVLNLLDDIGGFDEEEQDTAKN